ncbi:MlaD family protein [Conexibacter sp. W3-3-2]|uniref:MlaD family protein n=1 Tax=Conexibacter sp. W3-3-2 TaxID=2675227 RepID=UPI0018ABF0BD|nr:MlaD family protein [Conexibacter sp. W3-3-2]
MNLEIPRGGALALVAFVVASVTVLLILTARFGGPSIRLDDPYELRVTLGDTQGLTERSDVLVRGVKVGRVTGLRVRGGVARARLVLDAEPVDVHRGATVRVGSKTLLGEAYVDLVPGPAGAARLPSGATLPASAVRDTVQVDEALAALGPRAREDLAATVREAGRGAAAPETAERVSGTLGELHRTVQELHVLGTTLRDQTGDIAASVGAGRRVVGELAVRDGQLRRLVTGARTTLQATARRDRALRATLAETPRLLATTDRTLRTARPLLTQARPLVADLRATARPLTGALDALPAAARDLRVVLDRAAPVRAAALPLLRAAGPVIAAARPAARRLDPTLRNVVTAVRYLEPRKDAIAAWFANTAALGRRGDAKGRWARFFIFADPAQLLSQRSSLPTNAYPQPGDAADNRPYERGQTPRLRPAELP